MLPLHRFGGTRVPSGGPRLLPGPHGRPPARPEAAGSNPRRCRSGQTREVPPWAALCAFGTSRVYRHQAEHPGFTYGSSYRNKSASESAGAAGEAGEPRRGERPLPPAPCSTTSQRAAEKPQRERCLHCAATARAGQRGGRDTKDISRPEESLSQQISASGSGINFLEERRGRCFILTAGDDW